MKNLKFVFLFTAFLFTTAFLTSCGSSATNTEQQGKEYTSAYVCPMHCADSGSETAGKCPVCGMDYVKNENHKTDGHDH